MEISKWHNLIPIKDNCHCLQCTYPLIFGPGLSDGVIQISPLPTSVAMATNYFGTKIDYNSALVENNCALFSPTPYFLAQAIWWCHLNFSPADYCCHGNEFWDKNDYNSAPVKDNCSLFALPPIFGPALWCHVNFSPEDPCCHGNQPFLLKDKIGCRLTRASNAEMQRLGYIAWQWDRYLVPQNVFLVTMAGFKIMNNVVNNNNKNVYSAIIISHSKANIEDHLVLLIQYSTLQIASHSQQNVKQIDL